MRNLFIYTLTLLTLLVSCEEYQETLETKLEIVSEQYVPSYTQVAIQCQFKTNATIQHAFVQYSQTEDFSDYDAVEMQKVGSLYSGHLNELQPGTTYYLRYYVKNAYSSLVVPSSNVVATLADAVAEITTSLATDVTFTSALVGGNIIEDNGAEVTEYGIVYATTQQPDTTCCKKVCGKGTGIFTTLLENLTDSTTYYVRAYAVNRKGVSYGKQVSFTTKAYFLPEVVTISASDISDVKVTVGGRVESDGYAAILEQGIVYGTTPNAAYSDTIKSATCGIGTYTLILKGLTEGTTYYYRAFAKNIKGISCGEDMSFTTNVYSVPSVTTSTATNVTSTTATIGGNVTSDGGMTVTERGIVYSIAPNPTTADTKLVKGSGTGSYSIDISNLKEGTTYYVRAYAINSKGTSYGEQYSFTTKIYCAPSVKTSDPTNVSLTTATVGGNVTSDGGAAVTERGVVYSTSPNPTTSNSKKTSSSGVGSFSIYLSGLSEGTIYYVRAYAINSKGTSYGAQKSFTTSKSSSSADGHDWVDLGLSVKWATCNVGADSPEEYGDYFAWGETQPKSTSTYNWNTYKWGQGDYFDLTKYCNDSNYGTVDNKTQLDLSDDAARANWGGSWRMPTHDELTELREKCSWTWTTQNGVKGYKVTSKTNGNSIYLPAAGFCGDGSLDIAVSFGCYWSSSYVGYDPLLATSVSFSSSGMNLSKSYRCKGLSVRPVCP